MNSQWLLTYAGIGYLLGLTILGPAIFSGLLRDLHQRGKIHRIVRDALLLLQFSLFLGGLVFVMAFVARHARGLEGGETYTAAMAVAVLVSAILAFGSLGWLNTKLGKPWHGRE